MHSSVSHPGLHPNQPPTIKVRLGTPTSGIFKHLTFSQSRVRFYWVAPGRGRSVRSRLEVYPRLCYYYGWPGVAGWCHQWPEGVIWLPRMHHSRLTMQCKFGDLHRTMRSYHVGSVKRSLFASGCTIWCDVPKRVGELVPTAAAKAREWVSERTIRRLNIVIINGRAASTRLSLCTTWLL